jgi:hypothetical protein
LTLRVDLAGAAANRTHGRAFQLAIYLIKHSNAISQLGRDQSSEAMELALAHQQKFWRLAGVIVLISIVLFVVGIVAAIAIPSLMRVR